jgi:hypothetical protein
VNYYCNSQWFIIHNNLGMENNNYPHHLDIVNMIYSLSFHFFMPF